MNKKNGIELPDRRKDSNDWKLVDAHDVIVHIFHPEKREFYDLEKMWLRKFQKKKQRYEKYYNFICIFF